MKINKLIVLISTAMLIACSGQSDEAEKLGFSSVDEMNEIQAKGWHTKAKYDEDQKKAEEAKLKLEVEANVKAEDEADKNEAIKKEGMYKFLVQCHSVYQLHYKAYAESKSPKAEEWKNGADVFKLGILKIGNELEINNTDIDKELDSHFKSYQQPFLAVNSQDANLVAVKEDDNLLNECNRRIDNEPAFQELFSSIKAEMSASQKDKAPKEASSKAENKDNLNQWGEDKAKICRDFAETRQACATAADFSQCMDIKDKHRSPYNPSIAMWMSDQYSCEVDGSIKKY